MFLLIALTVYPVCLSGELRLGNRDLWEFGWAYGIAWGAAIFLFGGIVLLLLDAEPEGRKYVTKERVIIIRENTVDGGRDVILEMNNHKC